MSSSGTDTARCCSSVSTGAPCGVEEPPADLAHRAERHQFVEHPGIQEAALEQRRRRGDGADAEQHHVGAPPASSVREITESLRIEATVDGSA